MAPIGYSQVKTSETISKDLTFIKGTIYTIPNEEFRDFLHNATSVVPENVREQVYLKNADDTYLFPSIEGSTTYKDATTLDANSE
ncbi:hypothetical protein FACS1894218_2360 [Bacilli bacterium]|nr:hypothetical protein FACS1894218_2360 [Bacilli bacterium]